MTTLTAAEIQPFIHQQGQANSIILMVQGAHCAACIRRIEDAARSVPGVQQARLNLSTRRLTLAFGGSAAVVVKVIQKVQAGGYGLTPYQPPATDATLDTEARQLLRYLVVSGAASANVMLLSVALWSGDMSLTQKLLLQWFSALIVLPSVAYAGQPYFRAAWQALQHRQVVMEVPISLALVLTTGLSLFDTIAGYESETYFESAIMLLFFLLTGRYLESLMRGRSHLAAQQFMGLQHVTVAVLGPKGRVFTVPSHQVQPGQTVLWRLGERLGVDGIITQGSSTIDTSILTGESLPQAATIGHRVQAGTINRGSALHVKATQVGTHTVLAELSRLIETATNTKNTYTRMADAVARQYAPVVHVLAVATFSGALAWGLGAHTSLLRAAAVLIVTCPCAMALAVPTVQVAIMGRLLRQGVVLKQGTALEKLPRITHIVLDKTGTLTGGQVRLARGGTQAQNNLAARLAVLSGHPLAQALVCAVGGQVQPLPKASETIGQGVQGMHKGQKIKFGSAKWCGVTQPPLPPVGMAQAWFRQGTQKPVQFLFTDELRPDAAQAVQQLHKGGYHTLMLSGDAPATVAHVASQVGITQAQGGLTPQAKQQALTNLKAQGAHIMMVGDGLNDAPSLALADVGVSFGQATDLAQLSADIILQQGQLTALPRLLGLGRVALRAVRFNFGVSFAYNIISVPLAMGGYITPLWAAVLMSTSSLIVVANAARLGQGPRA